MHFSFAYFTEISALVPVAACNGAMLTVDYYKYTYIKFDARHNIVINIPMHRHARIYLHISICKITLCDIMYAYLYRKSAAHAQLAQLDAHETHIVL